MAVNLQNFALLRIFYEGVVCIKKFLGYNLLIRPKVQLYLYSDIKYN